MPDRDGKSADIVLGLDDVESYEKGQAFLGATVGRVANRIRDGRFTLEGKEYRLAANDPPHHLHGGATGFFKRVWDAEALQTPDGPALRLRYLSKDGEEGYPGNLTATTTYTLTQSNELKVEMEATTDRTTLVNLAHHSYWNLGGVGSGPITEHELTLFSDAYTPGDPIVPTGAVTPVRGTPFDFTSPKAVGRDLLKAGGKPVGYDHEFRRARRRQHPAPRSEAARPKVRSRPHARGESAGRASLLGQFPRRQHPRQRNQLRAIHGHLSRDAEIPERRQRPSLARASALEARGDVSTRDDPSLQRRVSAAPSDTTRHAMSATQRTLAWGVIGTGAIAADFVRALRRSTRCRVVSVCGSVPEKATRFARRWRIPRAAKTLEELCADPQIGAIYVATPHVLHELHTLAAIEAGKHVLCEKPLALDAAGAERMIEAARRRGTFLMEGFMYRCHPLVRELLARLAQGMIGEVRHVNADFGYRVARDPTHRLFAPALGGGAILDVGGYPMSLVRLIAGVVEGGQFAEPTALAGGGFIGPAGADELATAQLRFASGMTAALSCAVRHETGMRVVIYGERGRIILPNPWFPGGERQGRVASLCTHVEGRNLEAVEVRALRRLTRSKPSWSRTRCLFRKLRGPR